MTPPVRSPRLRFRVLAGSSFLDLQSYSVTSRFFPGGGRVVPPQQELQISSKAITQRSLRHPHFCVLSSCAPDLSDATKLGTPLWPGQFRKKEKLLSLDSALLHPG